VKEEEENERKRNKQLENLQVKSRGKRATHAPSWHGRRCAAAAGKMLGTSAAAAGRRAHDGKANDSST
jgi:hypothetical protein